MADCRIINEKMKATVTALNTLAQQYATAGADFDAAFMNSISSMEGEAKDALVEFFNSKYKEFITSMEAGIPAMIKGMADLLEANRDNFEKVDTQIAQSIRDGGK